MPAPERADEHPSNDELVERCRFGDRNAFEALYRATVGRVYAFALRMSGNRQAAEDVTQETYVRAWQSIGSFRGHAAVTSWLISIAIRAAVDHHRRESRYGDAAEAMEPSRSSGVDDRIDLDRALANLPVTARHVLVLYEVAGYRHAEIAGLLGMSVGTSKWHLHNARKLMIRELVHARRTE
jgi:RNA polymerase sigma-70 factor (ECF subfamily)